MCDKPAQADPRTSLNTFTSSRYIHQKFYSTRCQTLSWLPTAKCTTSIRSTPWKKNISNTRVSERTEDNTYHPIAFFTFVIFSTRSPGGEKSPAKNNTLVHNLSHRSSISHILFIVSRYRSQSPPLALTNTLPSRLHRGPRTSVSRWVPERARFRHTWGVDKIVGVAGYEGRAGHQSRC